MSARRRSGWVARMFVAAVVAWGGVFLAAAALAGPDESKALAGPVKDAARADATTLYNEGTALLRKGEIGPAVLLLTAASRLEPRGADIQANLTHALRLSAQARGEDGAEEAGSRWPLSAEEAWWLAAALLAAAVLSALGGRRFRFASAALLTAGIALSGALHLLEWREARRPEAVVLTPALSVEHGPDEAVRPTIVLGAGERVHIGRSSGTRVEVWIGDAPIGWAAREGLWRVADAARYTSRLD